MRLRTVSINKNANTWNIQNIHFMYILECYHHHLASCYLDEFLRQNLGIVKWSIAWYNPRRWLLGFLASYQCCALNHLSLMAATAAATSVQESACFPWEQIKVKEMLWCLGRGLAQGMLLYPGLCHGVRVKMVSRNSGKSALVARFYYTNLSEPVCLSQSVCRRMLWNNARAVDSQNLDLR